MTILNYFEMPTEEEVPPQEMWGHDEALTKWFEDVKRSRDSTGSPAMETIPDMNDNELTSQLGL